MNGSTQGRDCWTGVAMCLSALLSLGGCAGAFDSRPPEEVVAERAGKHLEHLRLQEWDKAIKYTSKAFRSAHSAEDYGMMYRGSVSWLDARIGKVECDAPEYTKCKVGTYVTTRQPQFSYSNERYRPRDWWFIDGNWYIYETLRR